MNLTIALDHNRSTLTCCEWHILLPPSPMRGGGMYAPPPSLVFCPLLKLSVGIPYLKILNLAKLFVADAPMKQKKIRKFVSPPPRAL